MFTASPEKTWIRQDMLWVEGTEYLGHKLFMIKSVDPIPLAMIQAPALIHIHHSNTTVTSTCGLSTGTRSTLYIC